MPGSRPFERHLFCDLGLLTLKGWRLLFVTLNRVNDPTMSGLGEVIRSMSESARVSTLFGVSSASRTVSVTILLEIGFELRCHLAVRDVAVVIANSGLRCGSFGCLES
jgi:hypothetical protein